MRCHLVSALFVLATRIVQALATPLAAHWDNMRIKHDWGVVPANWKCLGFPSSGTTIDLRIALRPHHENALIDALYEVSDIGHPKYGAHLSKEQVADLVAPHPDTLELVNSWLEHHGVSSSSIARTHGGSWLTVSGVLVSQANELLGASYQLYRQDGTNDTILRTVRYGLPAVLYTHVETVAPTTHFASTHMVRHIRSGGAAASREPANVLSRRNEEVTPSLLRWLYKTAGYVPAATGRSVIGITGYLGQYPSPSDLSLFMDEFRTIGVDATYTVEKVNNGGYDPNDPGYEANMDIQYTQGIAYPVPHIFYSTGGSPPFIPDGNTPTNTNEPYLDWLNYMLAQSTIPPTITTSYGSDEQTVPRDYAKSVCLLFGKLGLRGVSVIFSSGNDGVGGSNCMTNDGTGKVQFLPLFPASCPWVTSVGGTTSHSPEVAASFSGGGFSNYFDRPKYQDDVDDVDGPVSIFLKQLGTVHHAGLYNPTGRGIPDLAAQAEHFVTVLAGVFEDDVDGTSFAAPTVAGVISLLNDYLLRNNRSPLGFLNPLLYGRGRPGLNDITSGSNPGCGTDGFHAIVGWDPVTGLGTPNFDALEDILDEIAKSQQTDCSDGRCHPTYLRSIQAM